MANLEKAIDRIKILQCPTGELEDRVAGILAYYNVATRNEIIINRDEALDKDGAEAYTVKISDKIDPSITILARSGHDDYVAQVVDAYLE